MVTLVGAPIAYTVLNLACFQVVVTKLDNVVFCERLFVEPLSVDDWEILVRNVFHLLIIVY